MVCVCIIAFFATMLTGPDGKDWLRRRRAARAARLDAPRAQVRYLPSNACRRIAKAMQ